MICNDCGSIAEYWGKFVYCHTCNTCTGEGFIQTVSQREEYIKQIKKELWVLLLSSEKQVGTGSQTTRILGIKSIDI